MLIRDNQQKIENENKFKVLKRELNVINQNNILKCEIRLKIYPEQSLQNYHYLAKLTVWDIHLKLKYAVYEQLFRQEFGISQSGQFVRNIYCLSQVARQHCMKSVWIRNFSGPYFPAFGLNTERYGEFGPNAGK